MDKHFDFPNREKAIYELWEQAGIFKPESALDRSSPVFNICLPPPNANGELHLGHAFGYTVMDILGRFHRLKGEQVLLLPGKDHAGIQTQVVFEKRLKAEHKDLHKIPVTDLYQQCYEFCIDRSQYMRSQEKRLGLSADWSRELFTLDPRLTDIIYETFERLWNDGLVYKGHRIVNWSVFSQTSISDVEVEYKEQEGKLWYILYPLSQPLGDKAETECELPDGTKFKIGERGIVVATTRPETMLGDTGLIVHPDDPRYRHLIGQEVILPIVGRKLKIIGDKRVDPTFGTGVVKVTPAHDFLDYEVGQEHKLEIVQVIGKDGRMTEQAGEHFVGLTTVECRAKLEEKLEHENLILAVSKMKHKVPIGERGKDVIEPLISEQWFIAVDKPGNSIKQRALEFLRNDKVNIYPSRFKVLFEQWLENLRDWNISRQLWWGHRLPVWYKGTKDNHSEIYVGKSPPDGTGWVQEEDIFDTWFSSGQWAFSTVAAQDLVNLSENTPENDYFPNHTMVMGRDILFFWACRMLLLTSYRLKQIPWKNIFFTGLIRDEHGQKMSKSKGNGIEPNEIIEKHGADALRLALVMGATPGNDISISTRKIEGYSKFINKLWNAAKLFELKFSALPAIDNSIVEIKLEANKWILNEVSKQFESISAKLNNYDISIAADELYNFTWTTFCDWYLEIMKVQVDKGSQAEVNETLVTATSCLRTILLMLHPFIPFVTEEIYQSIPLLKEKNHQLLAAYPWQLDSIFSQDSSSQTPMLDAALDVIQAVRSVKAALGIPHKPIQINLSSELNDEAKRLITEMARVNFCEGSTITAERALKKPYRGGVVTCEVDGKDKYRQRIEKDIASNQKTIADIERKLDGPFATHADPELVEKERQRLEFAKHALRELSNELSLLS